MAGDGYCPGLQHVPRALAVAFPNPSYVQNARPDGPSVYVLNEVIDRLER